jgi:hypothetical protein
MANSMAKDKTSRPYKPSLLSPAAPMGHGANTRTSMTSPKGPRTSMYGGERTHEHGMPGDHVHDAHIKMSPSDGGTHLAGAVEHLEAMKKMRPDTGLKQ